jgi:hypothetical protein
VVTMKNGVFWDVTPCGSCKKRRFGGNTSQRASVASYSYRSEFIDFCHPDEGGSKFLRNVGSYKSHAA